MTVFLFGGSARRSRRGVFQSFGFDERFESRRAHKRCHRGGVLYRPHKTANSELDRPPAEGRIWISAGLPRRGMGAQRSDASFPFDTQIFATNASDNDFSRLRQSSCCHSHRLPRRAQSCKAHPRTAVPVRRSDRDDWRINRRRSPGLYPTFDSDNAVLKSSRVSLRALLVDSISMREAKAVGR